MKKKCDIPKSVLIGYVAITMCLSAYSVYSKKYPSAVFWLFFAGASCYAALSNNIEKSPAKEQLLPLYNP